MTKEEQLQMERLERLLAAERERSVRAWECYREALWDAVDLRMKLKAVEKALRGEE